MERNASDKNRRSANAGAANRVTRGSTLQVKFDSLIKACAHSGDIESAERLLRMMSECNEPPNLDNYNAIVHVCTQAGDVARAQVYLRHMEEIGLNPNTITYNLVINACATQNDAAEAEKWLVHMIARGLKPNEVTYGTICKVLARQGAVHRIEEIMTQLESNGSALNEYFYASLISSCGAASPPNAHRAEKALFEMVARGLRPKSVKRALARVIGERRTQQLFAALELRSSEQLKPDVSKQLVQPKCAGLVAPPGLFPQDSFLDPYESHQSTANFAYDAESNMTLSTGASTPPGLADDGMWSPPGLDCPAYLTPGEFTCQGSWAHGQEGAFDCQVEIRKRRTTQTKCLSSFAPGMTLHEAARMNRFAHEAPSFAGHDAPYRHLVCTV